MHTNAKLIRDFHEALNRFYGGGDIEAVRAMLVEDITWHVPGRSAIAGDHVGTSDVLEYFHLRRRLGRGAFKVSVHDVVANDNQAVLFAGGRAERDGGTTEWETVGIFRIEDAKIAECWLLPFDQYAFDELWSNS